MQRKGLNLLYALTLTACVSIMSIGCAGSGASSTSQKGVDPTAGPSQRAQMAAAENPKVEEAKTRCESEIKKSELQPGDTLSPIQIKACLFAINPEVAGCTSGPKREVVVKIVIEKTGQVSNAFPVGDTADSADAKCVAENVKKATFPKFKGKNQQMLKYPFTLGE